MAKFTIGIDPGHGGSDPGAVGMGYREKDITLSVSLKLKEALESTGRFSVIMSRSTDNRLSENIGTDLSTRCRIFNQAKVHAVISIHMNSASQAAWGVETYTWDGNSVANKWGDHVHNAIIRAGLYSRDRGRKFANFAMLRETDAVACLVEMAFINSNDVNEVVGKGQAWADALAQGVCDYFGVPFVKGAKAPETSVPSGHPIISEPTVSIQQMQDWAKSKGATETFVNLAPIFYDVAHVKGVDPAGVYAQSAKETGYGKFGGVLDETYKNPCGLKTTEGGGDYDPNAHQRFESWEQGITAQVDHLLLYAGQPQDPTPDPRHFAWIAGKAMTWEDLGGNWAPSASYGDEIVRMMQEIGATPKREAKETSPPEPKVPEWAVDDYNKAIELGITDGQRPHDQATRMEVALMIVKALSRQK